MYNYEKMSSDLITTLTLARNGKFNETDLYIGNNDTLRMWELIIKYIGDIEALSSKYDFTYVSLYNNFAVITIKQEMLESLSNNVNIVYIDKPKSIFFEKYNMKSYDYNSDKSCFENLRDDNVTLTGKGVLAAVIDTGINYLNEVFIKNNKTKILEFWNQETDKIYTENEIQNEIDIYKETGLSSFGSNNDYSGHGTAVAGIISENAPDVQFIIVKLLSVDNNGLPRTSSLMRAINYVIERSIYYQMPLVVNLSYGNNYGAHNGTGIIEQYIDSVALISKNVFVIGMGNEGDKNKHISIHLKDTSWQKAEIQVGKYTAGITIQIWFDSIDNVDVIIVAHDYEEYGAVNRDNVYYFNINQNSVCVVNSQATPFNRFNEVFISINSTQNYIDEGIWGIKIRPKSIVNGVINMWLPSDSAISGVTKFLYSNANTTLTIPASSKIPVCVGAYNSKNETYVSFSGRGYTTDDRVKPDICAPGVDVIIASGIDKKNIASGTSFATPFVSAASALLMQWGIIEENDSFLYGEKLKAALIKGARKINESDAVPNEKIGYGALCVYNSLEYLKGQKN